MFTRLKKDFDKHRKEESGAVMLIIAAFLVVLLAITALTVDYGIIYFKAAEYQKDLDAAARAASIEMMKYLNNNPSVDMNDAQTNQAVNLACKTEVDRIMKANGYDKLDTKNVWWSKVSFEHLDSNYPDRRFPVVDVDGYVDCDLTFGKSIMGDVPVRFTTGGTAETIYINEEGKEEVTADVVYVLDISGSMYYNFGNAGQDTLYKRKMNEMVVNVNESISSIMAENENNRIGVVVYSGRDKTQSIINLTKDLSTQIMDDGTTVSNKWMLSTSDRYENFINYKLDNYKKKFTISGHDAYVYAPESGGTFTQLGIYKGCQMLMNATNVDDRNRFPALFVMTDGEATFGNKDYQNLEQQTAVGEEAPVIIYEHTKYSSDGSRQYLTVDKNKTVQEYDGWALYDRGMYYNISSIRIGKGYKVTVYSEWNFSGKSKTYTEDDDDFTNDRYGTTNESWNDRVGSLKIEKVGKVQRNTVHVDVKDIGKGYVKNDDEQGQIGAYAVLTPCYWKPLIQEHYDRYMNKTDLKLEAKFYSMGFALDTITYRDFAEYVLFPEKDKFWDLYNGSSTSYPLKRMLYNLYISGVDWYNPYDTYYDATKDSIKDCLKSFTNDVIDPIKIYTTKLTR